MLCLPAFLARQIFFSLEIRLNVQKLKLECGRTSCHCSTRKKYYSNPIRFLWILEIIFEERQTKAFKSNNLRQARLICPWKRHFKDFFLFGMVDTMLSRCCGKHMEYYTIGLQAEPEIMQWLAHLIGVTGARVLCLAFPLSFNSNKKA